MFGIHTEDHRLGDASRDAVLHEIAADRAHLAAVEAIDDAGLSPAARFERDLEVHNLRTTLFDAEEVRRWERTGLAAGEVGDAIFLLFARGRAPLAERLERITDRLEQTPAFLRAPDELRQLQLNLVRSHAAELASHFPNPRREMTLLRANVLTLGFSGIRWDVIELLCEMLNRRMYPVVPEKG